jgi:nitrite reductase/ring-hydroxylating ferredoxin subunit
MKLHDICDLIDIPEQQARGFRVNEAGHEIEFFIVCHEDNIYGYLNHCPHTGVNLNWQPDRFLDGSNQLIQCTTHGAQFRIHNGYCVRGPCRGRSLSAIKLRLENGRIKISL